jgi:hypothetical protein
VLGVYFRLAVLAAEQLRSGPPPVVTGCRCSERRLGGAGMLGKEMRAGAGPAGGMCLRPVAVQLALRWEAMSDVC